MSWKGIAVVGSVTGIGFTMAIFIAELAFTNSGHLAAAKLAVLAGSAVAAAIGLLIGRIVLRRGAPQEGPEVTVNNAEASTAV